MTILYPRAFPLLKFSSAMFDIRHEVSQTPEQGGELVSVEIAVARWIGEWTIQTKNREATGIWSAWLSSLKNGGREFLGRDVYRPTPYAHRRAGLPNGWDGEASAWTTNGTRDVLSLTGCEPGATLSVGDYVGHYWSSGDRRQVYRILAPATVDGSGEVDLDIEPGVPPGLTSGAIATFAAPACIMKIVPGSVQVPQDGNAGRISFQGKQHLKV